MELFKIETGDHFQAQGYSWLVANPMAIVQITHGMMEHAARYDHFASWLNQHQIAVYASDHIGHGLTVRTSSELGHFPGKDDWDRSADILHYLTLKIKENHPGVPVFLLGHSMGSVMAQTYMIRYGREADGYILSGAVSQPKFMANMGILISGTLLLIFGHSDRSKLLNYQASGRFNKGIRPRRTAFDWISTDDKVVDEYVKSPLCGFPCTNGFYQNFFNGFRYISKIKNLRQVPPGMPVCIFAGRMDPVGRFGKDPKKINFLLTKYSRAQVQMKLYPEGRHEMLNEVNREEVYQDVLEWIRTIDNRN